MLSLFGEQQGLICKILARMLRQTSVCLKMLHFAKAFDRQHVSCGQKSRQPTVCVSHLLTEASIACHRSGNCTASWIWWEWMWKWWLPSWGRTLLGAKTMKTSSSCRYELGARGGGTSKEFGKVVFWGPLNLEIEGLLTASNGPSPYSSPLFHS